MVLIAAALLALGLANSPLAQAYANLLALELTAAAGDFVVEKPLLLWINDGLMGVFFFLVGLEIKREIRIGELSTPRKALLPTVAALGGMLVPAGIYLLFNYGGPAEAGWGVPMATDIAFALGVLALLGDRVPNGLRVFLAALAIVDDIGAVIVIAVFYTDGVSLHSLAIGGAAFAAAIGMNRLGVRSSVAYFIAGTICWLGFLKSGVHATIAAVMMAFTIPGRTRIDGAALLRRISAYVERLREVGLPNDRRINTPEQQHLFDGLDDHISDASSPLVRLEHALAPLVAFLVLPTFALANAGLSFADSSAESFGTPLVLGTMAGLCLGKPLGVTLLCWFAVKLGWADLPAGVTWRAVLGVSLLAGIGFTMALFISGLAFDQEMHETAKIGIFTASLLSGVAGWVVLRTALRRGERGSPSRG